MPCGLIDRGPLDRSMKRPAVSSQSPKLQAIVGWRRLSAAPVRHRRRRHRHHRRRRPTSWRRCSVADPSRGGPCQGALSNPRWRSSTAYARGCTGRHHGSRRPTTRCAGPTGCCGSSGRRCGTAASSRRGCTCPRWCGKWTVPRSRGCRSRPRRSSPSSSSCSTACCPWKSRGDPKMWRWRGRRSRRLKRSGRRWTSSRISWQDHFPSFGSWRAAAAGPGPGPGQAALAPVAVAD